MARRFAKIHVAIWNDADFRSLSAMEQHMYLVLISQARISLCGVLDYFPSRWAICCDEWTQSTVEQLIKGLSGRRYVTVDYDTSELLIRSFIRRDEVMKAKTVAVGAATDYGEVMSDKLRASIDKELIRVFKEEPELAGWQGLKDANPVLFRRVTEGANK